MNCIRSLFLLLLSFSIFSCGKNYQYQKKYELEGEKWTYADSLEFAFDIQDTTNIYNLYLEIEHSTSYAFQNLYTSIHTIFPSGERLDEKLSLEMANKAGGWYGECGRDYCTLTIPIQKNAYFNQEGRYTILLEQYMRQDTIPGIRRIAFMLEDTGENRQK
jgi:gliding motility-associated lipoprotein GldH